ncbi:hypothetical protein NQ294_34150, partial [Escherichia coli]|nr:hypothetical protein [Escherichia coli]
AEREISKDEHEIKQQLTESLLTIRHGQYFMCAVRTACSYNSTNLARALTNFGSFNPLITQAEPHVSHWILSLPAFF